MPDPILHKYVDSSGACFANVTLCSGERVFLSIARNGFAVFRLHLGGRIPGRRLFAADADALARMQRTLSRDADRLPPLSQATDLHRDERAMAEFLDAAIADLTAVNEGRVPGRVEALDVDNPPEGALSLLTRLALTARDTGDCVRLYERAKNTVG